MHKETESIQMAKSKKALKYQGFSYFLCMVRPEGVEPPTFRFEVCHSVQLSYGRTFELHYNYMHLRSISQGNILANPIYKIVDNKEYTSRLFQLI